MDTTTERRAFVLGISGATWKVMRPMIEAGELPNIQALCRSGVSGTLSSVKAAGDKHFRPQTAWPTLATGCLPEHHGLTRFFHTSEDLVRPTIWQLLSDGGRTVGLFGWPMTWPPRPINGFDIPCHHARDGSTWPPDLEVRQESTDHLGFRSSIKGVRRLAELGALRRLIPNLTRSAFKMAVVRDTEKRKIALSHLKQDIACELFRTFYLRFQPHASTFVTFLVDASSHRYWQYHDPSAFLNADPIQVDIHRTTVEDAYRKVDMALGRILSILPGDGLIAVVSENGMAPESTPVEIGPWQYIIKGRSLLQLVGLSDDLDPRPVARWIAFRQRNGSSLPTNAVSRFLEIKVAETGRPLFQVRQHRGEVIVKFDLTHAVDRSQTSNLEELKVQYRNRTVPFLEIASRANPRRSAMHDKDGIFVLSGPGIQSNQSIEGASIVDFAPTLLAAMGLSFPGVTFDGKVLDVFRSGTARSA